MGMVLFYVTARAAALDGFPSIQQNADYLRE
jgi:hypothetical protein